MMGGRADVAAINLGIENIADAEIIGMGGFATVYSARDRRLARRVAVKVLRRDQSDSARRRFDRECEIMGRLSDHPNVVTVHSAGHTNDGRPYIVMELLEEGSLGLRVQESGPLAWVDAVRYMIPVCEALDAAHRAGVLHRDIKPDNILLVGDQPRLTDFGIAQLQRENDDATDEMAASWHHSAPETLNDKRDERSDVYSLASTLYALIAGNGPFWDPNDRSLMSLVHRLVTEPPPDLGPATSTPELDQFFRRALAKDPRSRPQTAAQVTSELRRLLGTAGEPRAHTRSWRHRGSRWSTSPLGRAAGTVISVALVGAVGLIVGDVVREPTDTDRKGTLQMPYPAGQSVSVFYDDLDRGTEREWSIELLDSIAERADPLAGHDFSSGNRLVSAKIRVTYRQGTDPATSSELLFNAVGPSGTAYGATAEACGPPSGALDLDAEIDVSEAIEGRICWSVPTDELDALVLAVEAEPADGVVYLALN